MILAILGFCALMIFVVYITSCSTMVGKFFGEETVPLQGAPKRFDPVAEIANIKSKLGPGADLVELDANGGRSDGTMDLMADYKPAPTVSYIFERKLDAAPEGKTTPPVGAGRGPNSVWVEEIRVSVSRPGQFRHVRKMGAGSSSEYTYTMEGMEFDRTSSMREPKAEVDPSKVSFKQMWEKGKTEGATDDAVAKIEIDDDGYAFTISVLRVRLTWEPDGTFKGD